MGKDSKRYMSAEFITSSKIPMQIKDASAVYCDDEPQVNQICKFTQEKLETDFAKNISGADLEMWLRALFKQSIDTLPSVLALKCQCRQRCSNWSTEQHFDGAKCSQFPPLSFMIGMSLACQPHSKCINKV